MFGSLIIFEGLDQAGKATQSKLLAENLKELNYNALLTGFPSYSSTNSGKLIGDFLKKEISLTPEALYCLYAADRYETRPKITNALKEGQHVICDRYFVSGVAYGMARGLPQRWLETLDALNPQPDLIIYLDISPRESLARKSVGRDVFEKDLEFLERVRKAYHFLSSSDLLIHKWVHVDGNLSQEEISKTILERVLRLLGHVQTEKIIPSL